MYLPSRTQPHRSQSKDSSGDASTKDLKEDWGCSWRR